MQFGADRADLIERDQLEAEASAWEKVSRSADYAEPYPAGFPPDDPPA
ncbi:MAG: hypothetical protein ACRDOA_04845 [Streptosporangiaceae bacterium]